MKVFTKEDYLKYMERTYGAETLKRFMGRPSKAQLQQEEIKIIEESRI